VKPLSLYEWADLCICNDDRWHHKMKVEVPNDSGGITVQTEMGNCTAENCNCTGFVKNPVQD